MIQPLKASISLFIEFNTNNISYCHWKSNEHLLEGLAGETDLDVFVSKKDKEKAEELLIKNNYLKVNSQFGSRYFLVEDWITCDSDTGKLVHIHLHYLLITGHKGTKEYTLPFEEEAIASRMLDVNYSVFVIDPTLELLILLIRICLKSTMTKRVKSLFGKYNLSKSDYLEINYLMERFDKKRFRILSDTYFGKDSALFYQGIEKKVFDAKWFSKTAPCVKKHFKKYIRKKAFVHVRRLFFYFITRFRLLFKKHFITRKSLNKGISIAFIGQDGAGKSTVSKEVEHWLMWKLDARKFYLGSGEHYSSWQNRMKTSLKRNDKLSKAIKNYLTISNLIKIAKVAYKKIKQSKKYKLKGGIAIFDRYPQIQFEGINDGPKIRYLSSTKTNSKYLKKRLLNAAKKEEKYINKAILEQPDLVFKLKLSTEESLRRKPEETYATVSKKHSIIEELDFPKSVVIDIDATQEYEDEIRLIHTEIWRFIVSLNKGNLHHEE